jgi:hypothetical protein
VAQLMQIAHRAAARQEHDAVEDDGHGVPIGDVTATGRQAAGMHAQDGVGEVEGVYSAGNLGGLSAATEIQGQYGCI